MMATELARDTPINAPASAESQHPHIRDASNLEPTTSTGLVTDIETRPVLPAEEEANSASVCSSEGSDVENSASENHKTKDDERGHARASSIRKPATFKAVSVNKTFLATKTSASSPKLGEKSLLVSNIGGIQSGSTTLSASRPRLVAKTGGARDSSPRFSSLNGGRGGGTPPDPSAVWNKNKPTPTPEPKKFTDEELKKYGIHMASRLPADDSHGQSNWADIDEDDDDWAPDALTWTDGTKITLPQAEEVPSTATSSPVPVAKELTSGETARLPAMSSTASPLTKPTSLATTTKGLILKVGSSEKPTLVMKPPAPPTPAKSPWAPLPPVDKISPVGMDAPDSYHHTRLGARESIVGRTHSMKEISADDFNRSSWRENSGSTSRELYNSHSGRYEPVNDRRNMARGESQGKQPSLLQRPTPHDSLGEHSLASQPSRYPQEGGLGRRRGSSNVSGGSGFLQRIGKSYEGSSIPPPEVLATRRTSIGGSNDGPVSPRHSSPSSQHAAPRLQSTQAWNAHPPPATSHTAPQHTVQSPDSKYIHATNSLTEEQTVEYQKKLMRERAEEAMKRRLQEEKREEAARAERIRLKLEAMGPAPERKSTKRESKDDPESSTYQSREGPHPTNSATPTSIPVLETSPKAPDSHTTEPSSPAGAGDESEGVHQSTSKDAKQVSPWEHAANASDRFTASWGGATAQQLSRNVWASPNNDRGLGNGTFNPDLGRIPDTHGAALPSNTASKGPAPIAPPTSTRLSDRNQVRGQAPPLRSSRYASDGRAYNDRQNHWVSSVLEADATLREQRLREKAELDRQLSDHGITLDEIQPEIKHTWRPGGGGRPAPVEDTTGLHHNTTWEQPVDDRPKPIEPVPPVSINGPVVEPATSSVLPPGGSAPSSQTRPSRFFPSRDSRADPLNHAETRPKSPSPPPPTMDGHPVYDGDVSNPHVSLPKPHIVVKLPPSAMGHASILARPDPSFSWTNPGAIRASSTSDSSLAEQTAQKPAEQTVQQEWQEKIYKLTGRKTIHSKQPQTDPPVRHTPAPPHNDPHSNSPFSVGRKLAEDAGLVTSKPQAEECFEEQEIGSLPQIRIPREAPTAAWQPVELHIKPLPRRFVVIPTSTEPLGFVEDTSGTNIRVHIPGMPDSKLVPWTPHTGNNSRAPGNVRTRQRGPGLSYRGGKRDASSSSSYTNDPSSTNPTSHPSRSRGAFRGRSSDNWHRRPTVQSS